MADGEGARTGAGLDPERVLGLVALVGHDVEEEDGVALAEEVVDGPPQRRLATLREVERQPDLPPTTPCHLRDLSSTPRPTMAMESKQGRDE